jgi:UDP-3-O-[3-hydroxymyristoyl] glucosamine N-acyltransferase
MIQVEELFQFDTSLKSVYKTNNENKNSLLVSGISNIDNIRPKQLVFVKNESFLEKLEVYLNKSSSSDEKLFVIIDLKLWNKLETFHSQKVNLLKSYLDFIATSENVMVSMCHISKVFYDLMTEKENNCVDGRQMGTVKIHPTSLISQGVFIGNHVEIGANVQVGSSSVIMSDSLIGENSIIYPNVTIYPRVKIGRNVRVHSGSVIGADGFGYHFHQGKHLKIWHMGGVHIDDEVEIGACSAVDAGTFSPTTIGAYTKIDNHVQVGHNCKIGKGVIFCGHVAVGGSTQIGDFSVFGGKSGVGPDLSLGSNCQVAGGALVNCDWPDAAILGGHPARPLKEWMKGLAHLRKMVEERKNSFK